MMFHQYLLTIERTLKGQKTKLTQDQLWERISLCQCLEHFQALVPFIGEDFSIDFSEVSQRFILARAVQLMRQFRTIRGKRLFILELQSQVRIVLNVVVAPVLRLKALILMAWIQDKCERTKANQDAMLPDYLSSKVQFIHDVRKGRFCQANQSIEAGEVILMEEPIASIVYHPEDLFCHCCAGLLLLALPCPTCPDVLFCSLKCLETSLASYHKRECKIRLIGILKKLAKNVDKVSFGKIIALRLITQRKVLQLEQLQPSEVDETLLPEPDISDYDVLWSLYALKGSIDHTVVDALLQFVFNDLPTDPPTPLKEVVRRYSKIVEANSFAIEAPSLNPLQGEGLSSFRTLPVEKWQTGSALYLKASLFNHSCNPSGAFVFFKNRIIIAATQKIDQGEEVSISYGPLFYYHDKEERQLRMKSYDFKCDCDACLGDWPDWTSISTGLVPESMFSPSKWEPKDFLMETDTKWPLVNPEQFISAVQTVQESERAAKISNDQVTYRSVMKTRGQILHVVKPPHFCHLKTRLGVTTGLWHQYWSEYEATG